MSAHRAGCLAVRCCDQEACGFCGLQWDHDDPDPPACRREELTAGPMPDPDDYFTSGALFAARQEPPLSERIRTMRTPPRGWSVALVREPVVVHGLHYPDNIVPHLSVDGFTCGPLCAPIPDTARGRLDLWELVLRLNVRRS